MLGPDPVDVVDFALQGTVVVVLVDVVVVLDVVVVVLDVVVVVVPPPVVVVVPPLVVVVVPPPPANEIGWVCWAPPATPKAITQESPAVTWAAVGGQG